VREADLSSAADAVVNVWSFASSNTCTPPRLLAHKDNFSVCQCSQPPPRDVTLEYAVAHDFKTHKFLSDSKFKDMGLGGA
jgi:hypothetical protein